MTVLWQDRFEKKGQIYRSWKTDGRVSGGHGRASSS